ILYQGGGGGSTQMTSFTNEHARVGSRSVAPRRRPPRTPRDLDLFGDGQHEFIFIGTSDHLNSDRQAVGRKASRDGRARKACKVEPLRKSHSVAIAVLAASCPGSIPVPKCGGHANRREQ